MSTRLIAFLLFVFALPAAATEELRLYDNGLVRFRYPAAATLKPVAAAPGPDGAPHGGGLLLEFAPDAFLVVELAEPPGDPVGAAALRAESLYRELAARLAAFGYPPAEETRHTLPAGSAEVRFAGPLAAAAALHRGAGIRYTAGGERYRVETVVVPVAAGVALFTAAHPEEGADGDAIDRARRRIARDLAERP